MGVYWYTGGRGLSLRHDAKTAERQIIMRKVREVLWLMSTVRARPRLFTALYSQCTGPQTGGDRAREKRAENSSPGRH